MSSAIPVGFANKPAGRVSKQAVPIISVKNNELSRPKTVKFGVTLYVSDNSRNI